jgi:hypothetical protein
MGQYLVFPAETRTDRPDFPKQCRDEIVFDFLGTVPTVYAVIAVRLINSLPYGSEYHLYRNSAVFTFADGKKLGFGVDYPNPDDEGAGRLSIFFDSSVDKDQKIEFVRYIDYQLRQLVPREGLVRRRTYWCCEEQIPARAIEKRRERGDSTVICPICGVTQAMDNLAEQSSVRDPRVVARDKLARAEQSRQSRLTGLPAMEAAGAFQVFLCYNSHDQNAVEQLASDLKDHGVLPWWDREMLGGDQFTREIERILNAIPSIAVILGGAAMGSYQEEEYLVAIQRNIQSRSGDFRPVRVIPVLLPGGPPVEKLPAFLATRSVIDLRNGDDDREFRRLVESILSAR